jgi:hypothetical protein
MRAPGEFTLAPVTAPEDTGEALPFSVLHTIARTRARLPALARAPTPEIRLPAEH